MVDCWVGVASRDHVQRGVESGFCQLGHGNGKPLDRLKPGDRIIYYSPRERLDGGETVQAVHGDRPVLDGPVRQVEDGGFRPFRRDIRFFTAHDAPIRPMLEKLSFTRGKTSWGFAFRRGVFRIDSADCAVIAKAMGVALDDVEAHD